MTTGDWLTFFRSPRLESDEHTRRGRLFHVVAWNTLLVVNVALLVVPLTRQILLGRAIVLLLAVNALFVALILIARRGYVRVASGSLVAGLVTIVTMNSLRAGGIRSPGVGAYLVFVLMAGVLLGEVAAVVTMVVCSAVALGLVVAEAWGALPPASVIYDPSTLWVLNCLYMGIVILLSRLTARTIGGALKHAEAELARRRQTEREREGLVAALSERVKELRLLHQAASLLQSDRPFTRAVLEELVVLVPQAWSYHECCESRIAYRDVEVTTAGWRDSPWRQSASFVTSAGPVTLDVVYLEERPPAAEGPFLSEERALIDSLTEMLAAYLERDLVERQRGVLESQLRQSQKMEALGTLAGGIAHDFNNILAAIGGNAELALAGTSRDAATHASLEEILKATSRAADIVRRILLFSRKRESDRQVLQPETAVLEALRLLRASLPQGIQIVPTIGVEVPAVLADATQIHQIVMNLGTNADHAMRGNGQLSVEVNRVVVEEPMVALTGNLQKGVYARISVRDTGTGVSPEIVERLFEPFFTTKGAAGTGLGLSVVHGIVQEHGGAITVESDLGRGTSIHVYLPAVDAGRAGAAAAASPAPDGRGQHILYVDDEEALVFLMTRMLTRLGYRCTGYTDPSAALQAFRTDPHVFDAAITDLSMPGMTGFDFARELMAIRPGFPVALISGHGGDADAGARAGINVRIHKPTLSSELGRAVHALLAHGSG